MPTIAYKIHTENAKGSEPRMPLAGMAIGDGLCDPINQMDYAPFLFETGLVTERARDAVLDIEARTKEMIRNREWDDAVNVTINDLASLKHALITFCI